MKILVVLLLLGAVEAGGYNSLLNFPGPDNTEDYVLPRTNIPPLSAFTVCTWVLHDSDYDGFVGKFFFSYATENGIDAILLGERNNRWYMEIHGGKNVNAYAVSVVQGQWYHTCFTWSTSGEGTVFVDGVPGDTGTGMSKAIKVGGGVLVIGQDQDTLGGGFYDGQSFIGQIYNENFWNRVLSDAEIMDMYQGGFCGRLSSAVSEGIIVSWDDIVAGKIGGAASLEDAHCPELSFNCECTVEPECTWEVMTDMRNNAAGNGIYEGHEDAQKACLGFDGCNGISCNKKGQCLLKTGAEDIQKRNGFTVYRLTCS